jgi:glutamate-1-semialdehyde 2,1-aminomutase
MSDLDPLIEAYRRQRPGSVEWHRRARELFAADGATHFTRVRAPFRPYIVRADGSRKWDVDGNEYLDYVMGHGALVLGHGHPAVTAAVQAQAARGLHFGDNHPLEVEWAELIRELMPGTERVEFFACGQEANLMAIRLCRAFTGRRRVLRLRRNYHGWADELAAEGTPGAVAEHVTVIDANDLELVTRQLASREFAVFLVEGGGGYLSGRVPTDVEYFRMLPDLTRRHGTVLLLDEVVTGFREARGGWQEVVGIRPDLTVVGKAVSGGLPCGALLGRADIMQGLNPANPPDRRVTHGGTWNAIPLTCAAGIAACQVYRGGTPQRVMSETAGLLRRLGNAMLRRLGVEGRLFGRSVVHIYLGPLDREPADDTMPPTTDLAKLVNPAQAPVHGRLDLHLLQREVATMRGEAFILSAAHSREDVERTVSALEESLVAMREEGTLVPDGSPRSDPRVLSGRSG